MTSVYMVLRYYGGQSPTPITTGATRHGFAFDTLEGAFGAANEVAQKLGQNDSLRIVECKSLYTISCHSPPSKLKDYK